MWTRRDFAILTAAALGTFALTLGLFWTRAAVALDAKAPVTVNVKTPTLDLGHVRVSAALSHDKPHTVVLSASNTSDQPVTAHFRAAAKVVGASSPGSRSMPPATEVWSEGFTANLKPGESRQISVPLPPAAYNRPANAKNRSSGSSFLTLTGTDTKDAPSIQALTLHS